MDAGKNQEMLATVAAESADSTTSIDEHSEGSVARKSWKGYIWDTLDRDPQERRFLLKLDLALLTLGCLGFFTKYLDQANLVNAFVSGMREDLHMEGNQLNYAMTIFSVGNILGEIPSTLILTRIRPSIWIPSCQIIWLALTMCLAACKNVNQLYALRFFIGLVEAGYYPGLNYILGSWYRKEELGKRSSILQASGSIAQLFSGFLMTGVIHLDGRGNLPGWKWLFIMDGVISFPVAIVSYMYLPDVPETTRRHIFKPSEITLAQERMKKEERRLKEPFSIAKFKKILGSWHIYLLSLFYVCLSGSAGAPIFPQYLKYHKNPTYTLSQINLYPSGVYGIAAFSALAYAWLSDGVFRGQRWQMMLFGVVLNVVSFSSLAAWNISEGWKWACYYLAGQHVGLSGILFAWANEICTDDTEERAIVLATMNTMTNVTVLWLPLIVWQQIDAPIYHKGFITASVLAGLTVLMVPTLKALQDWDTKRRHERRATEAQSSAEPVGHATILAKGEI